MARSPYGSFNELEKELFSLREGYGLSIVTVLKINSTPHLLAALKIEVDHGKSPRERALEARETLIEFVRDCAVLGPDNRAALTAELNLDRDAEWYRFRLGARQEGLEERLDIGRKKRTTLVKHSVQLLAEALSRTSY